MDPLDFLAVRFHLNGEFLNDGREVHYIGGAEAMSYIERDKMSLPEVRGHYKDHCPVVEDKRFYWCFPGKELRDGLTLLYEDKSCQDMCSAIDECGVADIYVETIVNDKAPSPEESDFEDEMNEMTPEAEAEAEDEDEDEIMLSPRKRAVVVLTPSKHDRDREIAEVNALKEFYRSPNMNKKRKRARRKIVELTDQEEEEEESTDKDYIPGDESSSEEDEEGAEIKKKFKEWRKLMKSGQIAHVDDEGTGVGEHNEGENEGSSEFEDSFDEVGCDGQLVKKDSKYPRFKDKHGVPQFRLGMKFCSKQEFKQAIIAYGLANRKLIRFVKDDCKRVRAKCDWNLCHWVCLLAANSRSDSWQITSYIDNHVCPPRRDNKLVTSRRIAAKYEKLIRANPTWKISNMRAHIQEDMFADVSIDQVKRAKKLVMQKWLDATKGQYSRIFDYQLELLRSNPGSTVVVKLEPDCQEPTFQRIYVCLDALKKGFLSGCRRVVGLDGCFFKGATNGELLCAVGRDGNNQMYPVAWAVVEKELNESWDWFCQLLFKDLKVGDGSGWVFISDQQKGIINSVSHWAPAAEHRNCARHIYANWRKQYKKKEWQKLFWRCAKASSVSLFNLARAKLANETTDGANDIMKTDPHHWSRAWFRLGSNCDSVDNNICESFNKWIVEARFLPIISMLETIRRKVMVRIQENRSKSSRWSGEICPNINKKLNTYITLSGVCHAICNGLNCYEVEHYDHRFTVDLNQKTCSCRYWQLSGLPCPHAIVCIHLNTNCLDAYVATCYSIADFKKTYTHCLLPCEGMLSWPTSDRPAPRPPKYVKLPGRPRKERKREAQEQPKATRVSKVGTVIRCMLCKGTGHNRTTCSENSKKKESGCPSNEAPSQPTNEAPSQAIVPVSQQSTAGSSIARSSANRSSSRAESSIAPSITTRRSSRNPSSQPKKIFKAKAKANVKAAIGGSASMNLRVRGQSSQARSSVSIVTSGSARAQVSIQEPAKKKRKMPQLCLED